MVSDSDDSSVLLTVGDLVRWGTSRFNAADLFYGHGTVNAADEARVLVFSALALEHEVPDYFYGCRVTARERKAALALLQRRIDERLPAAYLTGEAWFAGLRFEVGPDVLVPRSPLGELVEAHFAPWVELAPGARILDLCTGSGCIAVACAVHLDGVGVDATDISGKALTVARNNVARYGVDAAVEVIESDLFAALGGRRYDLIVSNPPYVPSGRLDVLPREYRAEPSLALDGGADGLQLVARILYHAADHLTEDGVLIVEVGESAVAVSERWPQVPFTWPEFSRGGDGVFVLSRRELVAAGAALARNCA